MGVNGISKTLHFLKHFLPILIWGYTVMSWPPNDVVPSKILLENSYLFSQRGLDHNSRGHSCYFKF